MASKSPYKPKSIIKNREAKKMFTILIEELEKEGTLDDRTILIVDNMVLLEQLKQEHFQDVKERGVIELFKNGSQEIFRENKSVDKILKIVEQQRKLLSELCLTPSSAKRVAEVVEVDEFEAF
jgi:phage terminase small subunit